MNGIIGEAVVTSSSRTNPHEPAGFRTESEWFPWWQLALPETANIDGFTLEGLHVDERQPPVFSVLASMDEQNWVPLWTQALHEPSDPHNFSVTFTSPVAARYVRIRADSNGVLRFDNVSIETSPYSSDVPTAQDILTQARVQAESCCVVFSTLFNESDAFLARYIDNFLAYTPQTVCLALNFPAGRDIPRTLSGISPRVHIFNGSIKREKWGHTLLMGHIESFEEARTVFPEFRYFATMASNGLLVREFDLAAALMQLPLASRVPVACERAYELDQSTDPADPTYHGTWMWHHLRNSAGLGDYLKTELRLDQVSVTQIEGLFARREDWELLQERRGLIEGLSRYLSFDNFMALEELLPTSIFNRFGSGRYTHICRVLWSGTRETTVDDLLEMVPALPEHFCSLKWFDRSPVAQSTLAVTTDWGRALLAKAQDRQMTLDRFQETTLATKLIERMHGRERFGPLTNRWWNRDSEGRNGFRWTTRETPCERQQIRIGVPQAALPDQSPAFLFMEATGQRVSLAVSLQEDETDTVLRMSCSALSGDGGPVSGVHLQGYLYLSGLQGSTVFRMSIKKDRCVPHDILSRTVFFDEFGYTVDYADRVERHEDVEKHYFVREARHAQGNVWIGLPVFCNATVEVSLAVGPDFTNHRKELA